MGNRQHYRLLAKLFEYPGPDYPENIHKIKALLGDNYPISTTELDRFIGYLPIGCLITMQELYTRSFDVQAITTLDIGYVLFGDDYKRGELLANLNREHNQANNECGTELADFLPNVLRLLSVLGDEELIQDLAYAIIAPAVADMIGEFAGDRMEKRNESYRKHYKTLIDSPDVRIEAVTLYQFALKSLYEVLRQDFPLIETMPLTPTSTFLASIGRENAIEEGAGATR